MSDDTFRDWDIDDPDDCRELARRMIRSFEAMAQEELQALGIADDAPVSPLATMTNAELDAWLAPHRQA